MFHLNGWLVDLSICLIRVVKKVAKNRDKPVKVLTKTVLETTKLRLFYGIMYFNIFYAKIPSF